MSHLEKQWRDLRVVLKTVKCDREVEMVLEKHLHGGPRLIQACRDAQLYGIYEVPLLLPNALEAVGQQIMEELLETDAVRVAKRRHRLRELLRSPLNDQAQAEIAKIKEELEAEARENSLG